MWHHQSFDEFAQDSLAHWWLVSPPHREKGKGQLRYQIALKRLNKVWAAETILKRAVRIYIDGPLFLMHARMRTDEQETNREKYGGEIRKASWGAWAPFPSGLRLWLKPPFNLVVVIFHMATLESTLPMTRKKRNQTIVALYYFIECVARYTVESPHWSYSSECEMPQNRMISRRSLVSEALSADPRWSLI